MQRVVSRLAAFILLLIVALAGVTLPKQSTPRVRFHQVQAMNPQPSRNLAMKTLGGMQFWTDVRLLHDWRIQRNSLTGHYRLLDGDNYRHASGTCEECEQRLAEIRSELRLPGMTGRVVILIHGIGRSSRCFIPMQETLREEGFQALRFDYASTRISIEDAAEALGGVLESLESVEEIDLVAHSMGGLIVRRLLAEYPDDRVKRLVMIGTPNRGAEMADLLHLNLVYKGLWGEAGQQLVSEPEGFIAALPAPSCTYAVIAGARGTEDGWNPVIPGDDDGLVSVESTRLDGMADFQTVRSLHQWIMQNDEAIEMTLRFLRTGSLRGEGGGAPGESDVDDTGDVSLRSRLPSNREGENQ